MKKREMTAINAGLAVVLLDAGIIHRRKREVNLGKAFAVFRDH
jgi:hypothetical protein